MPNSDFQRHSFLGGEVSPSLYERADMEKFGKWFSNAENIRFRETGAFRNRCGFVKVADTKYNTAGQIIKLLSFAFNDEESFLIEMGPNYIRFYRNGEPIIVGDVPYELSTIFSSFSVDDLKYAQAGDTIFIVHPQYGIYELIRLLSDGTQWEFRKFKTDIFPMKEQNDDTSKTVTLTDVPISGKRCSILNVNSTSFSNIVFVFNSDTLINGEDFVSSDVLLETIQSVIGSDYNAYIKDNYLYILPVEAGIVVPSFSLSFESSYLEDIVASAYGNPDTSASIYNWEMDLNLSGFTRLNRITVYGTWHRGTVIVNTAIDISANTLAAGVEEANGKLGWRHNTFSGHNYCIGDPLVMNEARNSLHIRMGNHATGHRMYVTYTAYGKVLRQNSYSYNSEDISASETQQILTASFDLFSSLVPGESVLVKHSIDTQELKGKYESTGTFTLGPIKSDGNWRFYTLGNWAGDITIQYSTDNGSTWVDYYKWTSQEAKNAPANINTSGSLVTDDLVLFRVVSIVTATKPDNTVPCQVFFVANSFAVNSYYKILFKNSFTSAVVECVKNDVGTFSNKYEWRLPAFSNAEGWPQTVAFYQNRLFFGKDYIVYGSRSNDFWDFYEPIKLQADDPITMSLLSQKVNNIRNLVTQRSFFTFTAGGEFGIGSEGALTQSDKYLKPFSANGSAPCNPVLISDKVLFVDKSYNSIRALQYSLEADGYEAPDITLTLRALLENERIISTDIIYEEKEALFLSNTGTIWVLKYITDQNVLAWSHWRHAAGKITNICVVPNGAKHDLYIAVEDDGRKWIELLDRNEYMDTVEYFNATSDDKVSVSGSTGDQKIIIQGNKRYKVVVDENGQIDTPEDTTASFKVGSAYVSEATMLAPVVQLSEYHHGNYEVKTPFKVFFYYLNSYGFKVGVNEDEKMPIKWIPADVKQPDNADLTSGKKSVLIPSRFEDSARVSFVQNEPFPMEVADVLIQTDFGGK